MRHRFTIYLAIILILATGCGHKKEVEPLVRPVKSARVEREKTSNIEVLSGTVSASTEMNLTFRTPGTISSLLVKPGQYVKQGELIATLDDREFEATYQAAKSKYDQVNSEVNRVKELYERKSVAKNDYEKALAGLESVKAIYETATYQLENTKLYSPISGYVQDIKVSPHQMVTPLTTIANIVDTEQLSITTNLSSSLYMKRADFESFSAKSPLINQRFPLTLSYIAPKANNSQLYKMGLTMDREKAKQLAPGMIVEVTVRYKQDNSHELTIPLNALFGEHENSYVWVLDSTNMTVSKRKVALGDIMQNGRMVVLSGLDTNDIIITAGISFLKEGQKVKLENQPTAGNPTNQL